jgi:tetrahydromethanopterin:alpha-L-glutamate ligase
VRRRVALYTHDSGWHCRELKRAFARHQIETTVVRPQLCEVNLSSSSHGLVLPKFSPALPDGVFVRGVPTGSFEQVTFRMTMLHALDDLQVPVYNTARAIEKTIDKARTSLLLHHASIPTPATWVTENPAQVRRHVIRHGDLVIKPLFGSEGEGVARLAAADLPPDAQAYQALYYLQSFVDSGAGQWHDYRVFVIAGRAVAAMVRHGKTWINNVAMGARCARTPLDAELASLAVKAVGAIDMDYAGVDIIRNTRGEAFVLEVNSIPAWKGLQQVCELNIADALATDFVTRKLAQPIQQQRASQ